MLRALVEKIEPTLGPDEGNYRREFFRVDKAQSAGSLTLALMLIAIVFALEIFSFGAAQLTPIIIARVAFFTCARRATRIKRQRGPPTRCANGRAVRPGAQSRLRGDCGAISTVGFQTRSY